MQGQGAELSALDFSAIIGGPLRAVVQAQAFAAQTTTDFIRSFAFLPNPPGSKDPPKLASVTFDFSQAIGLIPAGSSSSSGAGFTLTSDLTSITVPLLAMVPIPYIRVEDMSINFNAKLHSVQTTSESNDFSFSTGGSFGFFGSGWNVSVSDKNTYQQNTTVDDTYSLQVTVHAVQDQLPGGLAQVLGIFSNLVQSQAALIQTIVTAELQAKTSAAQKQISAQTSSSSSSSA
jgi:hypothetical protein